MRRQKGFSLIELLIVVAIILIIAAIAIPNLLRSRISANEASAVGSLRSINTAEVSYSSTYPDSGYACSLGVLGPTTGTPSATAAGLIDGVLASGTKSGYSIAVGGCSGTPAMAYTINASPVMPNQSGIRLFCSDQTGIIRYDPGTGTCSSSSNQMQ